MATSSIKISSEIHYQYKVYCTLKGLKLQEYIEKVLSNNKQIKALKSIKVEK